MEKKIITITILVLVMFITGCMTTVDMPYNGMIKPYNPNLERALSNIK